MDDDEKKPVDWRDMPNPYPMHWSTKVQFTAILAVLILGFWRNCVG